MTLPPRQCKTQGGACPIILKLTMWEQSYRTVCSGTRSSHGFVPWAICIEWNQWLLPSLDTFKSTRYGNSQYSVSFYSTSWQILKQTKLASRTRVSANFNHKHVIYGFVACISSEESAAQRIVGLASGLFSLSSFSHKDSCKPGSNSFETFVFGGDTIIINPVACKAAGREIKGTRIQDQSTTFLLNPIRLAIRSHFTLFD